MEPEQRVAHEPILSNEFGNQFLYSVNGNTFANQSAQEHYTSILSEVFWEENSYHVVAGTDSGLLIEHVVNGGIPKNSVYLFIECPEYIEMVRPQLNEEWQQVLKFCTPEEWEKGYDNNCAASYFYNDKVFLHYSSAIRNKTSDLYYQLKLRLDFIYKNKIYENSAGLGNKDFIECQLNNVAHNINSSQLLNDAFKNKPCVILGGGPSLDEHLPWVIENQDRLVVIAVSRISRRLQEVGLVPDIVIALDPQEISFEVSKELYNYPSEVLLLNSYHVIPKLLSQWKGRSAYFGERVPWESKLNANKHFHEGPTVVNAALIAAVGLGCSQVYLTGADMCYASTGATHANGSFESQREIDIARDSQWLETYAGYKAETIIPLVLTANYLSKHAKYATENHVEVYNLSKNALKLEYIEYKSTDEIALGEKNVAAKEIIAELIPTTTANLMRQNLNLLVREFSKVKKDLSEIEILAKEAIRATEKAFSIKSSEKIKHNNRRIIEKCERKIQSKYSYLDKVIKTIAFKDFAKILLGGDAINLNDAELAERNKIYYQGYIKGVEQFKTLLIPASERLMILKDSYNRTSNFDSLLAYLSGREELNLLSVLLFQRSNEIDTESIRILSEFNDDEAFNRIDDYYAQMYHGLDRVQDKGRNLFKQHDNFALEKLIAFMDQSRSLPQEISDHKNYLTALYALNNNDFKAAIIAFSNILELELSDWDKEQLLNAFLNTEDFLKASEMLEDLTTRSFALYKVHAQVLLKLGKPSSAIEKYTQYLEVFQQDTEAWCQLGNAFIDMGIIESAIMAYEFVLTIEPDHVLAIKTVDKLKQFQSERTE